MVVTNPDGSKTTKTVEITVQRDTDRDGDPDVTDPDDDNDGVTDVEETIRDQILRMQIQDLQL